MVAGWLVLGVGVPGCRGASSGGRDRRCQDPGARGLGLGGGGGPGGPYHMGGGGGSNTEHGTIYIYIYIYVCMYICTSCVCVCACGRAYLHACGTSQIGCVSVCLCAALHKKPTNYWYTRHRRPCMGNIAPPKLRLELYKKHVIFTDSNSNG